MHARAVIFFWFRCSFLLSFPLVRFKFTPASSCIFSLFSPGEQSCFLKNDKEAAAPKPAATRGGGSSGSGDGGSGV
jgi:hypothetical protein